MLAVFLVGDSQRYAGTTPRAPTASHTYRRPGQTPAPFSRLNSGPTRGATFTLKILVNGFTHNDKRIIRNRSS
jgi:hypothetical protein